MTKGLTAPDQTGMEVARHKPNLLKMGITALLVIITANPSFARDHPRVGAGTDIPATSVLAVDTTIDLALDRQHDRIPGPVTVVLTNLNSLRYDMRLRINVTTIANPALPIPQIASLTKGMRLDPTKLGNRPSSPASQGVGGPAGTQGGENGLPKFRDSQGQGLEMSEVIDLVRSEVGRLGTIQQQVSDVLRFARTQKVKLVNTLRSSDAVLRADNGVDSLRATLRELEDSLPKIVEYRWPHEEISESITLLSFLLEALSGEDVKLEDEWRARALVEDLSSRAEDADSLIDLQRDLSYWRLRLTEDPK